MKKIVVTCKTNPDIDRFACAFAYKEFLNKIGQTAEFFIFGEVHDEVKYLLKRFNISWADKAAESFDGTAEIILVDCSDSRGLDESINPANVVEVIDHRRVNDVRLFPNAKIEIELVGAAATLIAEKFIERQVDISREVAALLYGAIISNTLNFKAKVTTARDRAAAQWLKEKGNAPDDLAYEMFLAKSDLQGDKLKERINSDFAWFDFNGKKIGIAQIEMIGAKDLVTQRQGEILAELAKLKNQLNLDYVFLSIIELEEGFNLFLTDNEPTQKILRDILNIEFQDNQAIMPCLIMRKEIVPFLKDYF